METTFSWAPFWPREQCQDDPGMWRLCSKSCSARKISCVNRTKLLFLLGNLNQTTGAMEQISLLLILIKILQYSPHFLYLKQGLPAPSRGAFPAWATKDVPVSREVPITPQSCTEHYTEGGGKWDRTTREKAHICHVDEWVILWERLVLSWSTITSHS